MSKNPKTSTSLEGIQNTVSQLTENQKLKQELGEEEFGLVKDNIDQMNQGIKMIDNNENIPPEQKINKKVDLIKDTIETLVNLNDSALTNSTLKGELATSYEALNREIEKKGIEIPGPFSMANNSNQLTAEKEVGKHLSNLQTALTELIQDTQITSNIQLAKNLNRAINNMESSMEYDANQNADTKSKLMLNAIGAISSIIKEYEEKTETKINVGNEIAAIGDTIKAIREENGLPEHKTRSDSPPPKTEKELDGQEQAIKTALDAINDLNLDKERLGANNHEKIKKMIDSMNKSITDLDQLHKENKISEEGLLNNKKAYVLGTINQIDDYLGDFEKALDKQKGASNFARVKNVLKAAVKVVLTFGSKEAKMELAAAQFQQKEKLLKGGVVVLSDDGKTKSEAFKESKISMVEKLNQARQHDENKKNQIKR